MREGLSKIARERIASEFVRTICNSTVNTTLRLMADLGVLFYVLGDYLPSDTVLSAMERSKALPHIRFGILLSEADDDKAAEILRSLKLSNKLISDSKRISRELRLGLGKTEVDARRLIGRTGELAPDVLDAAVALGAADGAFVQAVKDSIAKNECVTMGSLALHGDDVIRLGAKGREVGAILERLLSSVLEDPSLNQKEALERLALAEINRLNGENNG